MSLASENARNLAGLDEYRRAQAATSEILRVISTAASDPQPVFDLIVDRARDICGAYGAGVWEFDGSLIHFRAGTGTSDDPDIKRDVEAMYPMVPSRDWHVGRVVLDRRLTRFDDYETPDLNPALRRQTAKSSVMVPLMRSDEVIGVVGIGSREKGGFSDSQVELLKTFAEQAAIAITSAETWRALQERTAELAERNEADRSSGRDNRRAEDDVGLAGQSTTGVRADCPAGTHAVQRSERLSVSIRRSAPLPRLSIQCFFGRGDGRLSEPLSEGAGPGP